jgi:hypothetical protein
VRFDGTDDLAWQQHVEDALKFRQCIVAEARLAELPGMYNAINFDLRNERHEVFPPRTKPPPASRHILLGTPFSGIACKDASSSSQRINFSRNC